TLSEAEVHALNAVRDHYAKVFTDGDGRGIQPGLIQEEHMPEQDRAWVGEGDQLTQIGDFFFWTSWLSSTDRPGESYTYTNNWPYDSEAGNEMSYSSVWWSAASVALLIGFIGLIVYVYWRYKLDMEEAYTAKTFPQFDLKNLRVTPSQLKSGKYFAVVALL